MPADISRFLADKPRGRGADRGPQPSRQQPTPSRADEHLTKTLQEVLKLIDVRVIDHIVIGGSEAVSMAECGLV